MRRRRHLAVVWTPARTLRELARGDPRALERATLAVGRRLAADHARGVVHGQLSPDHAALDLDGAVHLRARPDLAPAARRCAAPEVLRGAAPDPTADQYAFAATVAALWPPAATARPRVRAALLRALAVEPAARWPRVDELVRALTPPRRWPWALAAAAATALVAAWRW